MQELLTDDEIQVFLDRFDVAEIKKASVSQKQKLVPGLRI